MPRDPHRCERCAVYWQPDAAPSALRMWRSRHGQDVALACVDQAACDRRIRLAAELDRRIATAKRRAAAGRHRPPTDPDVPRRAPVTARVPVERRNGKPTGRTELLRLSPHYRAR